MILFPLTSIAILLTPVGALTDFHIQGSVYKSVITTPMYVRIYIYS